MKLKWAVLFSITLVSACARPEEECREPEPPFVLPEGTYSKFGDVNIIARENCVRSTAPLLATTAQTMEGPVEAVSDRGLGDDEPDDRPGPVAPPTDETEDFPERPQPLTFGDGDDVDEDETDDLGDWLNNN